MQAPPAPVLQTWHIETSPTEVKDAQSREVGGLLRKGCRESPFDPLSPSLGGLVATQYGPENVNAACAENCYVVHLSLALMRARVRGPDFAGR